MSQTSYSNDPGIGFAGMRADNRPAEVVSRLNEESSANLPFGTIVKQGTVDRCVKAPSSSSDKFEGLLIASADVDTAAIDANAVAPKGACNVAKKGAFYVLPEQAVAPDDPVYVRYTAGAGALTVGRLRKDPDGTAQVDTVTPTAVNSAEYFLTISGRAYNVAGDGSATATEICDAFRTKINADADALAAGTGTATLILTAKTAGIPFLTQVGTNLALANTTASAAKAKLLSGSKFASTADADAPAILELNLPA